MNKVIGEKERNIFSAVLALAGRGEDLSAMKMQEIAAEADVGKSTLYEYFKSKEELLMATMSYCLQQEVELLGPKVQGCRSFEQLLEAMFDYISGLVQERVAAYSMLGQVLGGRQPSDKCPMKQEITDLVNRLMEFAANLAEQDGLSVSDREYFHHVMFSTLMPHAVSLLRLKNMNNLNDSAQETLRKNSRTMLLKALQ